jgi:Uma2 family endonuclease
MNELLRHPFPATRSPNTTQFADGFARRAWTAADVQRMLEVGIVSSDEPFELIGGELVAKMQKGIRHENLKRALNKHWGRVIQERVEFVPESPLRLGPHDEPEPDFFVFPADMPMETVRGGDALLVVEISDSSLPIDSTVKLMRYAAQGVREYWIINARTRATTVLRGPTANGYTERSEVPDDDRLVPRLVPEFAVCLADLV